MSKARDLASAAPAPAGVTSTELGYVDGVTSAIQTQVDAKSAIADNFAAGKNKIINGDFGVWQRGTSFSVGTNTTTFTADRYLAFRNGAITGMTVERSTDVPTGFTYSAKFQRNAGVTTTGPLVGRQALESELSKSFAGQTVTASFYAKAGANYSPTSGSFGFSLISGTGTNQSTETMTTWSGIVHIFSGFSSVNLTTNWTRFTISGTVPSDSNQLGISFNSSSHVGTAGADDSFYITGIQLEAGSTATPFQTATGTIQGELAACQRYYQRVNLSTGAVRFGVGASNTTTGAAITFIYPVTMRLRPTALEQSGVAGDYQIVELETITTCSAVPIFAQASLIQLEVGVSVASGLTAGRFARLRGANSNGFLGWSAEL